VTQCFATSALYCSNTCAWSIAELLTHVCVCLCRSLHVYQGRIPVKHYLRRVVQETNCMKSVKQSSGTLHAMETLEGKSYYSSYSFTTSALDGSEWPASRFGRSLPPGKGPPVPIGQEAGWGPTAGLDAHARVQILSPLPEIESRSPGRPVHSQTLY
jgi:hypothetical protein